MDRFGIVFRASPRQADVMIVAGEPQPPPLPRNPPRPPGASSRRCALSCQTALRWLSLPSCPAPAPLARMPKPPPLAQARSPTRWLRPSARSTTRCRSRATSCRWAAVPTAAATTTTPTQWCVAAIASCPWTSTCLAVPRPPRHSSTVCRCADPLRSCMLRPSPPPRLALCRPAAAPEEDQPRAQRRQLVPEEHLREPPLSSVAALSPVATP